MQYVEAENVPGWVGSDPVASRLLRVARAASLKAHAPQSGFALGAAGLVSDGSVVSGFNVESPSWALTVHAEVAMLVCARAEGKLELTHLLCCLGSGTFVPMCGLCRQLVGEQVGFGVLVATVSGWCPLGDLLVGAFTETDLGLQ